MSCVQIFGGLAFIILGVNGSSLNSGFLLLSLFGAMMLALPFLSIIRLNTSKFDSAENSASNISNQDIDTAARLLRIDAESVSPPQLYFQFDSVRYFSTEYTTLNGGSGTLTLNMAGVSITGSASARFSYPIGFRKTWLWRDIASFSQDGWLSTDGLWAVRLGVDDRAHFTRLYLLIHTFLSASASNVNAELHKVDWQRTLKNAAEKIQSEKLQIVEKKELPKEVEIIQLVHEPKLTDSRKPTIGRKVGSWKLIKTLGVGGFGEVFLATDSELPTARRAAIKIAKDQLSRSGRLEANLDKDFTREAKLSIAASGSPYVLAAFDFGEEPRPWIAYPFIEGKTLREFAQTNQKFSRSAWWNLAHDLLRGLKHLEDCGVVHRDLNPNNVMISGDRAIILDLGAASLRDFNEKDGVIYTPSWTGPEVVTTKPSQLTNATDIFSVGLVLYFFAKGKQAYKPIRDYSNWPQHVYASSIDYSGLAYEELELLSNMLLFEQKDRASVTELLDMVSKQVSSSRFETHVREYKAAQHLTDEDVYQQGFKAKDSFSKIYEGPFQTWGTLREVNSSQVIKKQVKMLTYYLVIQDTGVLYFQAISQAGGWLLEVGEYQWNEEKKLVAEWRNLLSLGWSPPVGEQAPNYHLYLKDYSGPNGIEERVIQAYEVAFGFTLSELASFALETRGSGYVSSGS